MGRATVRAALVACVTVAVVAVFAFPAGAATATRAKRKPGPLRVLLVGDSITADYQGTAASLLGAKGYQVISAGMAGTGLLDAAICRGSLARRLVRFHDPDVVVYESNGNYGFYPECSPNVSFASATFFKQWKKVAKHTQRLMTRKRARFIWILAPSVGPSYSGEKGPAIPLINAIYSELARTQLGQVSTVDAWTAFGGAWFDPSLHRDHEHLNASGAQRMAELVVGAVG